MSSENDHVEIRQDKAGFRWHRVAANGEVVSQGESYVTLAGALKGAQRANPDVPPDRIKMLP